ncbi:hypothetical protein GCM10007285_05250 [Stappia taiwanensis]|nr:hypothetical protein GCM10007285_05250 [Stappia taiwanensis]
MNGFVQPYSLAQLERGHSDDVTVSLYRMWLNNKGKFNRGLLGLSSHLLLLSSRAAVGDSPQILFSGSHTLATNVYGSDWATGEEDMRGSINAEFRALVSDGYHAVIQDREPQYELISGDLPLPQGQTILVRYERLLLPWRTSTGVRQLVCRTSPIEILLKEDGSSCFRHVLNYRLWPDHYQSRRARFPIGSRGGAPH